MASGAASPSDDEEAQPMHHERLHSVMELAQVCHFCTTFRGPLKLPVFTRTELQAALMAGTSGDHEQVALLAEVHFKLTREQTGVKLEKMMVEWEKSLIRKIHDNWQLEFYANPFEGGGYDQLTLEQRVHVLNALCHWKLESCAEIHKHLAGLQKDNDVKALEELRTPPIGHDDKGVTYWYFNDGCWVYAEERPTWQGREQRRFAVEFTDAKRIRLSINFSADTEQYVSRCEEDALEGEREISSVITPQVPELESEAPELSVPVVRVEHGKMDINMLCGSPTKSDEDPPNPREEPSLKKENTEVPSLKKENTEVVGGEDHFMRTVMLKRDPVATDATTASNGEIKPESETHSVQVKRKYSFDDVNAPKREQLNDHSLSKTNIEDHLSPIKKKPKTSPIAEATRVNSVVDSVENELTGGETLDEDYEITCEACQRSYDRRYLDPPLENRPCGEWRCFECLVNDARGWPRRRPTTTKAAAVEGAQESSRSSKRKSTSSSSKKVRSSSSSSKKSSSHGSRQKKSKSSSSGSKRSSKKHKKKKSSSSSRHHSSHHRNRHREDYAKLLSAFHGRKRDRLAVEDERIRGDHLCPVALDGPTGWRVVSSSLNDLRALVEQLVGGSLEQDRLRGKLISVLKEQERLEEEKTKKRDHMWQALPRRQSSRIAIGKIRTQTVGSDSDDDEEERDSSRRLSSRASRSSSANDPNNGHNSRERLALERESRARRRQRLVDTDDESSEDEKPQPRPDGWFDWSRIKDEDGISSVCKAVIERLLREEISELFARPVDPEEDGCPDYLTVIKHPIDLGTIRKRLDENLYQAWDVFKLDVERVWANCRKYNSPDTIVVEYANTLGKLFAAMRQEAERNGIHKLSKTSDSAPANASDGDDGSSGGVSDSPGKPSDSESSASEASSDEESDDDEDDRSSGDDRPPTPKTRSRNNSSNVTPRSQGSSRTGRRSRRVTRTQRSDDEESSPGSDDDSDASSAPRKRNPQTRSPRTRQTPDMPRDRLTPESAPVPQPKIRKRINRVSSSGESSSESSDNDDDSDHVSAVGGKNGPKPMSPGVEAPPPPSSPPPPPPPPQTDIHVRTPDRSKRTPPKQSRRLSPTLLNPYHSPASSSSSYFSSSDSDSSASGNQSSDSDSD